VTPRGSGGAGYAAVCTGHDVRHVTPGLLLRYERATHRPVPIVRPPNSFMICRTAGPRITMNSAGKMRNAMGIVILSGAVAALRSAFCLRLNPERLAVDAEHFAHARPEPLALDHVLHRCAAPRHRFGVRARSASSRVTPAFTFRLTSSSSAAMSGLRVFHLFRDP